MCYGYIFDVFDVLKGGAEWRWIWDGYNKWGLAKGCVKTWIQRGEKRRSNALAELWENIVSVWHIHIWCINSLKGTNFQNKLLVVKYATYEKSRLENSVALMSCSCWSHVVWGWPLMSWVFPICSGHKCQLWWHLWSQIISVYIYVYVWHLFSIVNKTVIVKAKKTAEFLNCVIVPDEKLEIWFIIAIYGVIND